MEIEDSRLTKRDLAYDDKHPHEMMNFLRTKIGTRQAVGMDVADLQYRMRRIIEAHPDWSRSRYYRKAAGMDEEAGQ